MNFGRKLSILSLILLVAMILGGVTYASYLHTSGNQIVDANGNPASLSGLSWFGFETGNYCPHGLWTNSMDFYLDVVKNQGFNHLRLPYCTQLFDAGSSPNSIDANKNPDLVGLSGIQIMDKLVSKCQTRGIRIYLDRHRPDSGGQSALWYTTTYDETRWINDWKMLASRYLGNDTVIGCDLHNEPHGTATWGTGDTATDWRLAAERCGNAILSVNPDLLIIVEGIEKFNNDSYWWGGNLMGAQNYPVRLNVANRLVYSAHDYGPGVFPQTWFSDPSFPNNMPGIWDNHWGYLHKNNTAPILVGEFGGRSYDNTSTEGKWQNALMNYIKTNGMHWSYWCLNPNSGDTGGILMDDWTTVIQGKMDMLRPALYPIISSGGPVPTPTVTRTPTASVTPTVTKTPSGITPTVTKSPTASITPTATKMPTVTASPTTTPGGSGSIKVQLFNQSRDTVINTIYPNFRIYNTGATAINLVDVKVRYYYTKDTSQPQSFWCDWATASNGSITNGNVTGTFVNATGTNTDCYCELGFTSGTIPAGGYAECKNRFAKADWSNFTQTNDYSFNATATDYVDWTKVTGYVAGTLKWGVQP